MDPAVERRPGTARHRVLLVEDDPDEVRMVRALLSPDDGWSVDHADRLSDALERGQREAYDAIIVDLGLPDAQGLDILDRIRLTAGGAALVVLTLHEDDETAIEAVRRGAQEYLVKGEAARAALARTLLHAIERKRMQVRLVQSQRLESLGTLAGGVAHRFNNLFNVALGHLHLALGKLGPDEPVRAHILKTSAALERATELSRQMGALSGRTRGRAGASDITGLVRDSLELLLATVPPGIELRAELGEKLPYAEINAGQVQQALLSLVTNAAEAFGANGGEVRVRTAVVELDDADDSPRPRTTPPLAPGRYVALVVEDDGCGMDDATRSRLFEPFFSTKFTGRGLGLSTVLSIVRGHDGGIRVESQPGRGTTVTLLFPARRSSAL